MERLFCGEIQQPVENVILVAKIVVVGTTTHIHHGDALSLYSDWDSADVIISDGAYGINGFDGDPKTPEGLADWYRPHIEAWTARSHPGSSLWFWNTEVGWATVHHVLIENGWEYIQTVTWNKGLGHIAGNVNSKTIRSLPVVTEVSALYRRKPVFVIAGSSEGDDEGGVPATMQEWLRSEWLRSGLPLSKANEACGVKSAASRKWLTADHMWYAPPSEAIVAMASYCAAHGDPEGAPYFEVEGIPVDQALWAQQRGKWNHTHGLTNVWDYPAMRNNERVRGRDGKFLHTNQKPLELMRRQILATTSEGDTVWEPFGGLCSASVAASTIDRNSYAAETNKEFAEAARRRVLEAREKAWEVERKQTLFQAQERAEKSKQSRNRRR